MNETSKALSFDIFKKIFTSFSFNSTKENLEQKEAKEKISHYFDECLHNKSYLSCLNLINNYYKPSEIQEKALHEAIVAENIKDYTFINSYYTKQPNIPIEIFTDWIKTHYETHYNSKNSIIEKLLADKEYIIKPFLAINDNLNHEVAHLTKNLKVACRMDGTLMDDDTASHNSDLISRLYSQKRFCEKVLNLHGESLELNKEILIKHRNTMKYVFNSLENYCLKLKSRMSRTFRDTSDHQMHENKVYLKFHYYSTYISDIETAIGLKLNNEHDNILQSLKEIHTIENIEDKINNNIKIKTINIQKDLPKEAQNLLETINTKYQKVKKSQSSSLDQSMVDLDILYQKNTVKIIEQFLSIDNEFKDSLKDKNGKSPENIMMDALHEVNSVLDNKLLEVNMKKIRDLSISNDVVQAKKLSA